MREPSAAERQRREWGEGRRVAGEKEGKEKKREKEKKRKKGEQGGGKGEKAGRGQKDSSEIKNGQAVGRVRVAIL